MSISDKVFEYIATGSDQNGFKGAMFSLCFHNKLTRTSVVKALARNDNKKNKLERVKIPLYDHTH